MHTTNPTSCAVQFMTMALERRIHSLQDVLTFVFPESRGFQPPTFQNDPVPEYGVTNTEAIFVTPNVQDISSIVLAGWERQALGGRDWGQKPVIHLGDCIQTYIRKPSEGWERTTLHPGMHPLQQSLLGGTSSQEPLLMTIDQPELIRAHHFPDKYLDKPIALLFYPHTPNQFIAELSFLYSTPHPGKSQSKFDFLPIEEEVYNQQLLRLLYLMFQTEPKDFALRRQKAASTRMLAQDYVEHAQTYALSENGMSWLAPLLQDLHAQVSRNRPFELNKNEWTAKRIELKSGSSDRFPVRIWDILDAFGVSDRKKQMLSADLYYGAETMYQIGTASMDLRLRLDFRKTVQNDTTSLALTECRIYFPARNGDSDIYLTFFDGKAPTSKSASYTNDAVVGIDQDELMNHTFPSLYLMSHPVIPEFPVPPVKSESQK